MSVRWKKGGRGGTGSKRSAVWGSLLLPFLLVAGCSAGGPQWGTKIELQVLLPAAPPQWAFFGALDSLVVVPHPSGPGFFTVLHVSAGTPSVPLEIEKRTNTPILAYPLLEGRSDLLKPAGGVYPLDLEPGGMLRLGYDEGFLAELLLPVTATGDLLDAVNVRRLRREIWERSKGDPWTIDREAILEILIYGSMRSGRIRRKSSFDLSVAVRGGTWVADDPFLSPYLVSSEQPLLTLEELTTGVHRFYRGSERVDIAVTEEGWLCLDNATGVAESGKW